MYILKIPSNGIWTDMMTDRLVHRNLSLALSIPVILLAGWNKDDQGNSRSCVWKMVQPSSIQVHDGFMEESPPAHQEHTPPLFKE